MKIASIVFISILLVSCSTLTGDKRLTTLRTTLNAYQTDMRWGNWDALFANFSPEVSVSKQQVAQLANVQIVGYEVHQPLVFIQEKQMIQVVEIQYVLHDEQRLHSVFDRQEWHYDAAKHIWRLYSPFPEFR